MGRPCRALLAVFVVGVLVTILGAMPGQGQPVTPSSSVTSSGATTLATDAELTPTVGAGDTPTPVGRPEPPRSQRIADSLIWLWVLVVLVGGSLAGAFTARRRPTKPDEADGNYSPAP